MHSLFLFFGFILISVISAVLLFNYFRSRKSDSMSFIPPSAFEKNSKRKSLNNTIWKKAKIIDRIIGDHFMLSEDEKALLKIKSSDSTEFKHNGQFLIRLLAKYIHENIRTQELINASSFHSIQINDPITYLPLKRLQILKLIDDENFFTENGFFLLCSIAKFMHTIEFEKLIEMEEKTNAQIN